MQLKGLAGPNLTGLCISCWEFALVSVHQKSEGVLGNGES